MARLLGPWSLWPSQPRLHGSGPPHSRANTWKIHPQWAWHHMGEQEELVE